MKTFLVRQREVLVTTYRVEAEDEEDAFDAIGAGDGLKIRQDIESMPPGDDDWEAEEET